MAQETLAPTLPSGGNIIAEIEPCPRLTCADCQEPLRLRMIDDPAKETVKIPASVVRMLLIHILEEMARGMPSL